MAGWKRETTFGQHLRSELRRRGWTVNDLSVQVNASPGYLHRVIQGRQDPAWSLVCAIADALEVSPDLFTDRPLQLWCPKCGNSWGH